MKFTRNAALAALVGAAAAAKDERTFAVLRFTNKQLTQGRMDPIVSPGRTSNHVHTVMGASNFGTSSTGETIVNSQCTNALINGDMSNYWFPSLYFHDEEADTFEPVEVFYVNAYYFFEATNDDIKAFPTGLQIVAGDAMTRVAPESGPSSNLDPSNGPVNAAKWTCPRDGNNYNPPSWPANSDGSMAGIGDPVNKGEGVGFPDMGCDASASPLRADIHFPSCYNPEAGLTDYQNNMAYPESAGDGKVDCPEGWIHVPHLFLEVYWNTPLFDGRWTPNTGKQPFVLSNGDATGFSSHADFMAGWDEELLQHIIDTCNAGTLGMDKCPGLFYGVNDEDCTIPSEIDEEITGELSALPGSNPLAGWRFGGPDEVSLPDTPDVPAPVPGDDDDEEEEEEEEEETPAPTSSTPAETEDGLPDYGLPEETEVPTNVVENPGLPDTTAVSESPEEPEVTTIAPVPEPTTTTATTTKCEQKIHTVWETVTVTAAQYAPAPSSGASSTNSTGSAGGFLFAGCFKDSAERALADVVRPNIGAVSNEACVAHCKDAGFLLAGTEHGGECYCGNELVGSEQLDDEACDKPCKGDAEDICGGDWALSVYSESGEASLQTSKVRRHLHAHLVHGHRRSHH